MAGEEGCGGGAVWLGRELEAVVELVGVGSCAGSPFIGDLGRWRRATAVRVAGKRRGVPLMALLLLARVMTRRHGRRGRFGVKGLLGQAWRAGQRHCG